MKKFLLALLAFSAPLLSVAQPHTTVSLLSGYTVPNSSEWSYIKDVSAGVDAAFAWRQDWGFRADSAAFFPLLRKPYWMGVRGNFTYFPNDIAGHRIGISGFLQQPLLEFRHRIDSIGDFREHLNLEMDFGLAFYTNPYCRTPNPDNVFIGSYANCMIQIGLSYARRMRDMSQVVLAAKFAHSSNGYLRKPNKGLNYLQLSVGYTLSDRNLYQRGGVRESLFSDGNDKTWAKTYRPWLGREFDPVDNPAFRGGEWLVSYAPGIVMPRYSGARRKYFYAHTAQLGWLYRFNPARAVGATLDLTYNYSHTAVIAHWNEGYSLPFYIAASAAYEATYHRFTIHAALAAYITRSEHGTTPLYERVGLYYNLSKEYRPVRHFVGVALKSHMAHIDFIEWHYGIKIAPRGRH